MAKKYTGSLSLDWFNKQKSILVQAEESGHKNGDVSAPKMNWINKDEALFYEVVDDEGRGLSPYWVDRSDLRVKEARPLVFQGAYTAVEKPKAGSLIDKEYKLVQSNEDDPAIENMLIRGDNLLALNALKKLFESRPDEDKVTCIYIDPPFNTDQAFELYDDALEHSVWLTMMRDRLRVLHQLLKESGSIFIHLDDTELGYLITLLDEIFGRNNKVAIVTFKQGSATGHKSINPGVVSTSNFVVVYAKNKPLWKPNRVFTSRERDKRYGQFVVNREDDFQKWQFTTLNKAFADSLGASEKTVKKTEDYEERLDAFVRQQAASVIRLAQPDYEGVGKETKALIDESKAKPNEIMRQQREDHADIFLINGQRILFYSDKLKLIDGEYVAGEPLTSIWDDVLSNNLHNEGGVEFPKAKKPEALLKRVFELSTQPDDLVLDCFGGSGTTYAVAQKMQRRWIGVEIGKQAETHILPRMQKVLTGADQSGISKGVNWHGGGSFKYYTLGESVIDRTTRDFNWKLGRDFIEQSLLSSYDFGSDADFSFPQAELIAASLKPSVGFHRVGQKQMAGVVSLVEPKKERPISYDELMAWYELLKKFKGTQSITIFTNRGVELAYDSKPEDLEVIKVPHAIFAELEK
jgi:adenine-specific DNA-methyltransferase